MTVTLDEAVAHVQGLPPSPVLLVDTCSFVDLFRHDERSKQPRAKAQEIQVAAELLARLDAVPISVHLMVPELIPLEYADHADREERAFASWTQFHDENQEWLAEASQYVPLALPPPISIPVVPLGLAARFRDLADDLLAKAWVLARDQGCLDRAVVRLIRKVRPSHKKEMKDSMNLEQCLELSRRLEAAKFPRSRVWVSSNTNDFAQVTTSHQLHPDLQAEFAAAGLKYFPSLRAAVNQLRAAGEIP